jgi:peroxiredoxin-like protein
MMSVEVRSAIMNEFRYSVTAQWTGGRSGEVTTHATEDTIQFSAPPEFKGEPGVWTPEHMLLSAVASCFVATFRAIAEASKFAYDALEVDAIGVLHKWPDGYRFVSITLRPRLVFKDQFAKDRALKLLEKTQQNCIVSKAIACLVRMEPVIEQPAEELVAAE